MRIVVVGDGKVGFKLAKQLSEDNYDVLLIDKNEGKLLQAINRLDIFCITGDGADADVLRQAEVDEADLVVAVTSSDEVNMISCLFARKLGAKHTIARVRNPAYYKQVAILKDDLHLSMAVNPEHLVAGEIARVLIFPDASKVEVFMKGRAALAEFTVPKGAALARLSLQQIYQKYQIKVLVCAVKRKELVVVPDGSFVIEEGDKLYITSSHEQMETFFKVHGVHKEKIKNVLICGGGRVSYYLAKQLESTGMRVKIIEIDKERCEELCELLPKATIIWGDASDQELLLEEGLHEVDAIASMIGYDEENIIISLFAKEQKVPKIIAKVDDDTRAKMVAGIGLDCMVSTKSTTANAIASYIAARNNSLQSAHVEAIYRLVDDRIEALEFMINEEAPYTNIALKDLQLKPNTLIACIGRNMNTIIPSGEETLKVGDNVIVVAFEHKIHLLKDILR